MAAAVAATSLADALPDFGEDARRRLHPSTSADAHPSLPTSVPVFVTPLPSEEDIEARVAAAVARAEAALVEEMARLHEDALEAKRAAHAAEIERIRAECGAELAATVRSRLIDMETRVADLATSVTARLLAVIVSEDVAKRSVAELAASIRKAIGDEEAIQIRIRGPLSLFESLSSAMGDRAGQLAFTEAPGADLTVSINETQFETRLAEWAGTIAGIVE